jgi:two-component system, LytTR family, response regulator
MIRTLIVDDEEPARAKLRRWLGKQPDIEIMGEVADGISAAHSIMANSPDLVFLDVQMPGMSGIDVAAQLEPAAAPLIVFVTAYDAHALAAFDLNAVDYILKPYDEERFCRALERIRSRANSLNLAQEPRGLAVNVARKHLGFSDKLLVPINDGLRLIDSASIHCLEAADNYVQVHTADKQYLLRRTLRDLIQQLGEQRFVRIHKSVAVNIAEIDSLSPLFKGDYELRLHSGKTLRLSRRYSDALFNLTGR